MILKTGGYFLLVLRVQLEYEKYCVLHQLWPYTYQKQALLGLKFMLMYWMN